ncbi:putative DD34D transposase [Trichonephila clavipes]|nr:putative DD34D transposase [Trichonephila clavipes]
MVTDDEKWVTYDNIVRKRSWSRRSEEAQTVAKPGLTSRKLLLCIWWDWKGIICYELFPYYVPELIAVMSEVRSALPLRFRRIKWLMHTKPVMAQSSPVVVEEKLGAGSATLGVVFITWFMIVRSVTA